MFSGGRVKMQWGRMGQNMKIYEVLTEGYPGHCQII